MSQTPTERSKQMKQKNAKSCNQIAMREYNDIEHGTTRLAAILGNPAEKKAKKSPKGVYIWVVIVYNDIKKNKRGDGLNGIW